MLKYKYQKIGKGETRKSRIVAVSDTHGCHDKLLPCIPDGDIFIHAGDFIYYDDESTKNFESACRQIDDFFGKLRHKRKFLIFGNHDPFTHLPVEVIRSNLKNVEYLQDELVEVDGLRIYGSPWTRRRDQSLAQSFTKPAEEMKDIWKQVPKNLDILVTHGPPFSLQDGEPIRGQFCDKGCRDHSHLGCYSLREHVLKKLKVKVHIYGHNHRGKGILRIPSSDTVFVNAAIDRNMYGSPVIIDFFK